MRTIGRRYSGSSQDGYPVLCDYCGVPWRRQDMVKDGGGRWMCPDDRGRSATELDRGNAKFAKRRRVPPPPTAPVHSEKKPTLLELVGSPLKAHWQPTPATVVASAHLQVSSLLNHVDEEEYPLVQNYYGAQPRMLTMGGPNRQPVIYLQDTSRFMRAEFSALNDNRMSFYVVAKAAISASRLYWMAAEHESSGVRAHMSADGDNFFHLIDQAGEAVDEVQITSPARDDGYHLFAIRMVSSGEVNISQIDEATTTPDFTASGTGLESFDFVTLGRSGLSGGYVAMMSIVEDAVDATDALVRQYVSREFGLW